MTDTPAFFCTLCVCIGSGVRCTLRRPRHMLCDTPVETSRGPGKAYNVGPMSVVSVRHVNCLRIGNLPRRHESDEGSVTMIHVQEHMLDDRIIAIDVSGVLDESAVPVIRRVCDRHIGRRHKVLLNLEAVVHITREGRVFIQEIRQIVRIANLPEFMKIDHMT